MIKRKVAFLLMLVVLAAAAPGNADAQFLKKLFGKKQSSAGKDDKTEENVDKDAPDQPDAADKRREEKEKLREQKRKEKELRWGSPHGKKKTEVIKKPAKPTLPGLKKNATVQYSASQLKSSYRVDVLIPLYLDDLVRGAAVTFKDKLPEKAASGLAFYQGLSIAADNLKKSGVNLDIYVHDVATFSESSDMLVNKGRLDSADLIIGAVQSHDIPVLATFVKRKHVNFVSALSPADGGVKDNPYFTLLQPSLKSHCEWIANDIDKKFHGQKVVLLYRTSVAADDNAYKYITADNGNNINFVKLQCNSLPRRQNLLTVFDTTRPNVVVVPVLDITFADSLLKSLARNFPRTHFEVYGMPPWNGITNLKKSSAYPNVMVKVTFPFNFNEADDEVQYVTEAFKKEYGGTPAEFVFRGYETLYWYANLLKKYGVIFNTKYKDNAASPFTRFKVKPLFDNSGALLYNENTHLFLSTYEGGIYKTEE